MSSAPLSPTPEWPTGKRTAYTILTVLFLLNVLNLIDRSLVSLVMEAVKKEFLLTDTQLGLIQGAIFLGIGLMTVPGGILLDRWGRKKSVTLMVLGWSASTAGLGGGFSFASLASGSLIMGSSQAAFGPSGGAWLSLVFPKTKLGMVNSIFQIGAAVGGVVGLIAGGFLISQTGSWRTPFYVFGGIGMLLGIFVMLMPDVHTPKDPHAHEIGMLSSIWKDVKTILAIPTFWRSALCFGTCAGYLMVFVAWLIPLAMRAYGLSEAQAGALGGVFMLCAMGAPIVGGIVADKLQSRIPYGRSLMGTVCNSFSVVCGVACILSAGSTPFMVFCGLSILNMMAGFFHQPAVQVVTLEVTPRKLRGTASAMQTLIAFLLCSSWTAPAVGAISNHLGGDLESLKIALLCLVPMPLIGAFTSYLAWKTYPIDAAKIAASEA